MAVQLTSATRFKSIALPPEHGAWGFLLEPLVLGFAIAPSLAGLFLALTMLGLFLVRHPLKIAVVDRRKGKRYARTRIAEQFVVGYGLLAAISGAIVLLLVDVVVLVPLLVAAPLGIYQALSYMENRGRDVLPEISGAIALSAAASSLALAGGRAWGLAIALWIIIVARAVPSILYIRARIRLEKGQEASFRSAMLANVAATGLIAVLATVRVVPVLAVVALVVLLVRAVWGLSEKRKIRQVKILGVLEFAYGTMVVLLTLIGYGFG